MLRWNNSELRRLTRDPQGPVGRDMYRRGKAAEQMAKTRAPVRTGLLRRSIKVEVKADLVGVYVDLISPVKYSGPAERRRPHLRPSIEAMRR